MKIETIEEAEDAISVLASFRTSPMWDMIVSEINDYGQATLQKLATEKDQYELCRLQGEYRGLDMAFKAPDTIIEELRMWIAENRIDQPDDSVQFTRRHPDIL